MAKILVFNQDTNRMESFIRSESSAMPYNTNSTLKVREFRGSSNSNILWTDKRTMQAWNSQRYIYGAPIYVGFAFKRPWEGGHGNQSQRYAGTALDVGQTLTNTQRTVHKIQEYGLMLNQHHYLLLGYILIEDMVPQHVAVEVFL